jgi:hypothetical protein
MRAAKECARSEKRPTAGLRHARRPVVKTTYPDSRRKQEDVVVEWEFPEAGSEAPSP